MGSPPENGEGRDTRQGVRPSVIGFPAPDTLGDSTKNEAAEGAITDVLAVELHRFEVSIEDAVTVAVWPYHGTFATRHGPFPGYDAAMAFARKLAADHCDHRLLEAA